MKHAFALFRLTSCLLTLGACQPVPPEAYRNPGDPEKLLVASSDLVTVDLTDKNYAKHLRDTLKQNPPTRAVLNCAPANKPCAKAGQMLNQYKIATESTDGGNTVTLVYEHVTARDCNNRYVDNSQNQRNLNYSSFGCSITGNTVQMVTDKRQFTNPSVAKRSRRATGPTHCISALHDVGDLSASGLVVGAAGDSIAS